jgi:Outer membrane protein beta-barrel domain
MKNLIVLIFSLAICFAVHAQQGKAFYNTPYKTRNSGSFSKSTNLLTFSYGFPNESINGYSNKGHSMIGFGPVYAKYEHGIIDEVGIGGQIALSGVRYEYNNNQTERIRTFHFAMLGYYHFNKLIPVKQLDVYAASGLAFRNRSVTYSDDFYDNNTSADVSLAFKVGARYYLKNNFAFYGEGGFDDMSDINLGVSFRF